MLNNLINDRFGEEYNPRPSHFFLPMGIIGVGGVLLHHYGISLDTAIIIGYPTYGVGSVVLVWMAVGDIIRRKAELEREKNDNPVKEYVPPKPEPKLPDGLKPIIRVDGRPQYAYTVKAPKLDREREMYAILWHWHESGREINLTETYWVKQKKFFKRDELAKDVKGRAEYNRIFCRTSEKKNSPHDVMDWDKVEKIARGGPLPRWD